MTEQLTDVIQICTDGSALAEKGVISALNLAKELGLPVVGMTSVIGRPGLISGVEHQEPAVQACLKFIADKAQEMGVRCELVAEPCESASKGIQAVADRYNARFIVMASRGLGSLGSLILGSETQKVLSSADRPVLVIR